MIFFTRSIMKGYKKRWLVPLINRSVMFWVLFMLPFTSSNYTFTCPSKDQWSLRSRSRCNNTTSYYCLIDLYTDGYREDCMTFPARDTKGYRKVFAGNVDGIECAPDTYQPFWFWTNGSSDCVYMKSLCTEEGQVVQDDGSNEVDRGCRCDYRYGYNYVTKPRDICNCVPSEEDCSCYRISCPQGQLLTPDYECRKVTEWKQTFGCPDISVSPPNEESTVVVSKVISKDTEPPGSSRIVVQLLVTSCLLIIIGLLIVWIFCNLAKQEGGGYTEYKTIFIKASLGEIPQNIREIQQDEVDKWKEQLETFVPTRAADALVDSVRENQCVIVTGSLGCGKTFTARYVTMQLSEEADGYDLLIISDPNDIIRYSKATGKQLIFIDDLFGKYSVDCAQADWWKLQWKKVESLLSRNGDLKIIATCRSHVLKLVNPRIQFSEISFLSDDICLNISERREIGREYLHDDIEGLGDDLIKEFDFFPKLCSCITKDDGLKELCMPITYITSETDMLYKNLAVTFLLFSLVVIKGYSITFNSLNNEINAISSLCREIGFQIVPDKQLMMKYLLSLRGSFFVEVNNQFSFKTEKLFEVIFLSISRHILKSLLQYGEWSVLKDCTLFESLIGNEAPTGCVLIPQGYEDLYFNRVLKDIKLGRFLDVFVDMKNNIKEYRIMFLEFLRKHFTCKDIKTDENGYTILHVVADQGYDDYLEFFADLDRSRINIPDNKGRTPLHLASRRGHASVTEKLIRRKGFFDVTDNDGNTPLHLACEGGHIQTVFKLLSNKAAIKQNPSTLVSALHLVCKSGHKAIASMLIRNNAEVNAFDKNRNTPLHFASAKSHKDICDLLLTHGANPNLQDSKGRTPLYIACENGRVNVVKLLLEYNANPFIDECVYGKRPLHIACESGDAEIISKLLVISKPKDFKMYIDKQDLKGKSSLYLASKNGHLEVVKTLLSKNADVNLVSKSKNTPLHVATAHGWTDIVCCFLNNEAEVNCSNFKKDTPLHIACEKGHQDIVQVLLNRGADVNAVNDLKQTPVHLACQKGDKSILKLLIGSDKVKNVSDKYGRSPLFIACENKHAHLIPVLSSLDSVDTRDKEALPILHLSCREGYFDVAKMLIELNADINSSDRDLWTPLLYACSEQRKDIAELLIENKADVNQANKDGDTPLHQTVSSGDYILTELLVSHGADINQRNKLGETPMWKCAINGHTNIARLLKIHHGETDITNIFNVSLKSQIRKKNDSNLFDILYGENESKL